MQQCTSKRREKEETPKQVNMDINNAGFKNAGKLLCKCCVREEMQYLLNTRHQADTVSCRLGGKYIIVEELAVKERDASVRSCLHIG